MKSAHTQGKPSSFRFPPTRVLICPDKFKGTLTATQAAERSPPVGARFVLTTRWTCSRSAMVATASGIARPTLGRGGAHYGETVDAARRPVRASWWWSEQRRTAIVESARVIGLAMLPFGEFHPFELDTFGLGLLLRKSRS